MRRQFRVFMKITAVIILTLLFIWIIHTDETKLQLTQPQGDLVKAQDVMILMEELLLTGVLPKDPEMFENTMQSLRDSQMILPEGSYEIKSENTEECGYITYEMYCILWQSLIGEVNEASKAEQGKLKELYRYLNYDKKYRNGFYLLKEDWYAGYDRILAYYGLQEIIKEENVEILCGKDAVVGKKQLEENMLLTSDGKQYTYLSEDFRNTQYTTVKAYMRNDRLLTLTERLTENYKLSNIWLMETKEEGIQFFYKDYELLAGWVQVPEDPKAGREQIADVIFSQGTAEKVTIKPQRISGKILRIGEDEIEIEGYGSIALSEECKGYRLYEELIEVELEALSMGYDFADFVLEDEKICAFLLVRAENMESIRVLLRNSGFSSLYQEQVQLRCEDEMIIMYGNYGERMEERISAGEIVTLDKNSDYLKGDRIKISPVTQSGKLEILSLSRSQGTPAYRGSLEIAVYEKGLVVINEVLLEEYLYSVVPSEMPASYPMEALKSQAVCARTYAYRYLENPGLGNLGAHVDDSTGYQVYNNIEENVNSTKAVKETSGQLLMYEGEPATTYYYSTSCGYGADERVWQEIPEPELPYLQPVKIAVQGQASQPDTDTQKNQQIPFFSPEDLTKEENFAEYISHVDDSAFEKEEAWYRWKCEVEELDVAALSERLQDRYQAVPDKILTGKEKEGEREYISEKPVKFKKIYDIRCTRRLPGGVMDELLIETDRGIYKVVSEYNIRYVLNQDCEVLRQDGSPYSGSLLLPSAYIVIGLKKTEDVVTGYEIKGGGYGHGAGMSQNGAKAMALSEMSAEEILSFFFKGCQVEHVY